MSEGLFPDPGSGSRTTSSSSNDDGAGGSGVSCEGAPPLAEDGERSAALCPGATGWATTAAAGMTGIHLLYASLNVNCMISGHGAAVARALSALIMKAQIFSSYSWTSVSVSQENAKSEASSASFSVIPCWASSVTMVSSLGLASNSIGDQSGVALGMIPSARSPSP